jgi:NDP-sugar pyrophosphorylase family protein
MDYNKYIKSKHSLQSVKLSHSIYIGENSTIGGGSSIFKSVICRNASVGINSSLKSCVVLEGSHLPDNSRYEHCLIEMFEGKLSVTSFNKSVGREVQLLDDNELFPRTP